MGNPLGVTVSNFFLAHLEKLIFQCEKPYYPAFYVRYVDEIFCIFRPDVDWDDLFALINSCHQNLEFTFEESKDSHVSFLAVNVQLSDGAGRGL